ncbi:MAG: hypothetical protein OQK76_12895 [Gammaproteobacteria bacterium]|nr:hypothetical protein [Gammaproteobacteria bacterium]MCW8911503.1 hypothetical protein [Gammaproteobacteria bacterium]MCW9005292.1 hypothetical protein [Gammaproteobacteria bacterium]
MSTISMIILAVITLALIYTYWCVLSSVSRKLRLGLPLAALVISIFLILGGGLFFLIFLLFNAGSVNAGSLLGMLVGIGFVLAGIRTFTCD